MKRAPEDWAKICADGIDGGYVPGGKCKAHLLYQNGQSYVNNVLRPLGLWSSGDVVVDIGCGNGRIAMQLVNDGIVYHGVDVIAGCIEFCQQAFEPYPDFHFYHIDVKNNRYNKDGEILPHSAKVPLPDDISDVVLASSLFSHLGPWGVATHYLLEVARIAKSGAALYSTWFISPPNEPNEECDRSVYEKSKIQHEIEKGFSISRTWGGNTGRHHDQMKVISWRI